MWLFRKGKIDSTRIVVSLALFVLAIAILEGFANSVSPDSKVWFVSLAGALWAVLFPGAATWVHFEADKATKRETGGSGQSPARENGEALNQEPLLTLWPTDAMVALLDSDREELRSYRGELYGAIAGVFTIPLATLAVQVPDFLHHEQRLAVFVFTSWLIGLAWLIVGLKWLDPGYVSGWRGTNEGAVLTELFLAVGHAKGRANLVEALDLQRQLLRSSWRRAAPFNYATFCCVVSFTADFGIFMFHSILHATSSCPPDSVVK